MGFRCPVCHKDFGKDECKLNEHINAEHDGAGALLKNCIDNICKGQTIDEVATRITKGVGHARIGGNKENE